MSQSTTIPDLRRLLASRFPQAPARDSRCVATGLRGFDEALEGGLGAGTFTEIVSAAPSCGGGMLTASLLLSTRVARQRLALLDAADAFDIESFEDALTAHLVWFRGSAPDTFWQAADIVLRDANFAVTVLDLRGVPECELRRLPATTWYRLQRAVEQSDTAAVVQTDCALVPCASRRLVLSEPLTMEDFKIERTVLGEKIRPETQLRRTIRRVAG